MARAPIASAASYTIFKGWAYTALQENAALSVGRKARLLFRECYARPVISDVALKTPLQHKDLLYAMEALTNAVGNRRASLQGAGAMDVLGSAMEYRRALAEPGTLLSDHAIQATKGYLHVYRQDEQAPGANWRIGVNVIPTAIPEATRRMTRIADVNANADHFKVTSPGSAGKPSSLILYMLKDAEYAPTRDAVLVAMQGLRLQETVSPMWNEIVLGIGEASEPPQVTWPLLGGGVEYMSFGQYRCILTAMAFDDAVANVAEDIPADLTLEQFSAAVDIMFPRYGVPILSPHSQDQIDTEDYTYNSTEIVAFMQAYAGFQDRGANTYTNARAVLRNNPEIV